MTITITEIELSLVRLDLIHEFETSSHRKSHLDHIVVRATASDGTVGWGECASPSDPYYCSESTESCWYVLSEHLAPMVLGHAWEHPDDATALTNRLSGNHFARAGLDMACWDLYGQARGETLATLVGGTAERISAGVSLGIEPTVDALLDQVARHVGDGYRRIKLKCRPGWDLEPVRAVRAAFPGIALQVDANTGYRADSAEHLAALTALDDQGLLMIEQPFAEDDLLGHAGLAARLDTPVCLDESITSPAVLATALHLGAADIVNIKVSRLGGIGPSVAVHDVCREAGVPVWCGGMHEFGIGRAANLAVASLPGFTLPSDVSGSDKYYRQDIVTPPIRATEGLVPVPDARPGLAVHVDESLIRANRLRHAVVKEG
ncbi:MULTISPECIES: o-succinylbenzoate synthase [unclassified Streptomyces]|jgi:O-succinylbenzoate synthase|uniref:o-succinylbenzoate synthase n=1 Tax=unclassified Streptomyces TaxID=2593676 RepID=UPI0008E8F2A6|nr:MULTISPECIES: o-succinylbenzoate synthase [unclassified Streptomyces]MDX2730601.1 o-succinylbenzoate synthase [Streptomyces sp. PA03-2a]SFS87145.1 O-succinylbenzoate synthase [Streptomyces sp. ok210]